MTTLIALRAPNGVFYYQFKESIMGKASSAKKIRKQNSASAQPSVFQPTGAAYTINFYTAEPAVSARMKNAVDALVDAIELDDPGMTSDAFDEVLNAGVIFESISIYSTAFPNCPGADPLMLAILLESMDVAQTLITKVIETDTETMATPIVYVDQAILHLSSIGEPPAVFLDLFQHFCDTCAKHKPQAMLYSELRDVLTPEGRKIFDKAAHTQIAAIEKGEIEALVCQPLPQASVASKVAMRL
jgi:hypothetical protein